VLAVEFRKFRFVKQMARVGVGLADFYQRNILNRLVVDRVISLDERW
jgi:hypothetical protein